MSRAKWMVKDYTIADTIANYAQSKCLSVMKMLKPNLCTSMQWQQQSVGMSLCSQKLFLANSNDTDSWLFS